MIEMMNRLPMIMFVCLFCTIVIEIVIALLLKVRDKKDLLNIALANMLTNPIVVIVPIFFNVKYGLLYRHISLYALEVLTVLIEGLIYRKYLKYNRINLYVFSLILNAGSYLIGLLINSLIY